MIYCILKGGLGNILFQIAAAKSMSIDKNIDCSFPNLIEHIQILNDDYLHNPNLKHGFEYIDFLKNLKTEKPTIPLKTYNYPFEYINYNIEDNSFFIDGFFQSEKYFKHNKEVILKYFCDFSIYDNIINEKYSFIKDKKCTSIHVRRGDYLKYPNHHPVQSDKYYLSAIEILKNEPNYFNYINPNSSTTKYIENIKDYLKKRGF